MDERKPEYYQLGEKDMFLVSQKALIIQDGKLLVLKSTAEGDIWNGRWELPGGLLEMNENMEDGLEREVMEETGLEISVGPIVAVGDYPFKGFIFEGRGSYNVRIIGLAYRCSLKGGEIKLSSEHNEYKWVSPEELKNLEFNPSAKFTIDQYLNQNNFSS